MRRALRILPPLIFYVVVVVALTYAGVFPEQTKQTIWALTFTCNLGNCGGWIGIHTWSLSVEEQFYLVIPVLFIAASRSVIAAIAAMMPIAVLVFYFLKLPTVAAIASMFLTIGYAVAYALYEEQLMPIVKRMPPAVWFVAGIGVLALMEWTGSRPATIANVCLRSPLLVFITMWTVARDSVIAEILRSSPLRSIGLVSYSLYLWQQAATFPMPWPAMLIALCGAFAFAYLSYWTIEIQLITFGRRLTALLRQRSALMA